MSDGEIEKPHDKLERLRFEVECAELEALSYDIDTAAGAFLGVGQDSVDKVEMRAALMLLRDAWAKFEAWQRGPKTAEALVTVQARAKRPPGAGNIEQIKWRFRWRLQVGGRAVKSGKFRTREEAEADLTRFLAGNYRPPERTYAKRLCGICAQPGHYKRTCPEVLQLEPIKEQSRS
jgi:hypothetical protein